MLIFTFSEEQKVHNRSHEQEALILMISQGNRDALASLYSLVSPAVYSFALSILKNTHDAEDVLSDCFLKIYSAAPSYRSQGKPMAWIMTITKNLCTEVLRKRQSAGLPLEESFSELTASIEDVETRLVLEGCLTLLDDTSKQIVVLHALSGFKHREIAELLRLSLPAVLSKYNRAVKKLKKHLQQEGII